MVTLKFRLNTVSLRAADFSITLSLTAEPLNLKLKRSLIEWRRRFLGGDFGEIYPMSRGDRVRLFAGLFDGDGFVKAKHRYAVDVGVSCGGDVKGRYVLGRYDVRSRKQYLRPCGSTLSFLRDVVGFLNHPERRFKLERFLAHRCA